MGSQELLEGRPTSPMQLDPEALRVLDEALANWDSGNSEDRKVFEDSQVKWTKIIEPEVSAITKSEQLTREDLAIRINTRD
jgi:hypothetical protein